MLNIIVETVFNKSTNNPVGEKKSVNPAVRVSIARQAAMLKAIAALGFDPRSRLAVDREPVRTRGDDNRSRTKQYQELVEDEDAPVLAEDND